jgi:hypothetical protein
VAAPTSPLVIVRDEEDVVEDIVPMISYDDKRCQFSKDGRYILPKREQFPSIFCGLRVHLRLEPLEGPNGRSPAELSSSEVEQLLCEDMDFGGGVAYWEDAREAAVSSDGSSGSKPEKARDIIAALSASLPEGREVGFALEVPTLGASATIIGTVETSDDLDPDRITALADCFREAAIADAIAIEVPQIWIIGDSSFKAKSASIGLYPGSYWMGFFKCWGAVDQAEIFFRTVEIQSPDEPMLHLVVQFKSRECLKMCFTFLHDRYLAHHKLELGVRPIWCSLVVFKDFKDKAGAVAKAGARKVTGAKPFCPKGGSDTRAPAKAAAPRAAKPSVPKVAISKASPAKAKAPRVLAPAAPGTAAEAAASAAAAAGEAHANKASPLHGLAPMTPAPGRQGKAPKALSAQRKVGAAPSTPAPSRDDQAMSPAEVMQGLSGRQLEVFQMVMTRMERLEKENQELMQILLQMQGLLRQQQQRNVRLTQAAGLPASRTDQEALKQVSAGVEGLLALAPQLARQPRGAMPSEMPNMQLSHSQLGGAAGPTALVQQHAEVSTMSAPLKRKVDAVSPPRDASPGLSPEGEAAPWKSQRRRQKRPRVANVGATTPAAGNGTVPASSIPGRAEQATGLAAHYNSLLGV